MATDIYTIDGSPTGNQTLGKVRFFHPNAILAGRNGETYSPADLEITAIESGQYEDRFDDITYYG